MSAPRNPSSAPRTLGPTDLFGANPKSGRIIGANNCVVRDTSKITIRGWAAATDPNCQLARVSVVPLKEEVDFCTFLELGRIIFRPVVFGSKVPELMI